MIVVFSGRLPFTVPFLDCKTAVFFANVLEWSTNVSNRRLRLGGSGDDRRFASSIRDC